MIWISKDIFSKTSNDFYFWPFFFYSKTYSCVWLLPFITKIFADGKSRGQKIGHFCGGHKWMTLNFKNLTVFCNIMVICGSWKSWRVVFTSGYTKKKTTIRNSRSRNHLIRPLDLFVGSQRKSSTKKDICKVNFGFVMKGVLYGRVKTW